MRSKMVTIIVQVIFLVSLIFSSGCQKGSQEYKQDRKTILKWSTWGTPEELVIWRKLITIYEEKHSDIKIDLNNIPWAQYNTKLQTMMAGGCPPDIMWMDDKYFPCFAEKDVFLNLGAFISKDKKFNIENYYQNLFVLFKYKDILYGIPSHFSVMVMFYNKNMFDEAKIEYPNDTWIWETFLEAAQRLTKDTNGDGRIDQFGFLSGATNYAVWMPFVWQNGGRVFNEDLTRCLIDEKSAYEAIQFLGDLINRYRVSPAPSMVREQGNMFMSGKVGMLFNWPSVEKSFLKINSFRWDIAPLPMGGKKATVFGGPGYVISKQTEHPDKAWDFLKFLVGPVAQELAAEGGLIIPTHKSVAESSIFLNNKNHQICLDALTYARPAPITARWSEVDATMRRELELVEMGSKSAKEVCERLVPEINKLLENN